MPPYAYPLHHACQCHIFSVVTLFESFLVAMKWSTVKSRPILVAISLETEKCIA